MELKNVLLIEDNKAYCQKIIEDFRQHQVDVLAINDPAELNQHLSCPPKFQMIILDWLLDGEDSVLAQLCLAQIRQTCFVPVIVYTEEKERFDDELNIVKEKNIFPVAYIKGLSKGEVTIPMLLDQLNIWHQQIPAKLSDKLRTSFSESIEEALYQLAEQSGDDLMKGLKSYIALGDSKGIDLEHAVDVLMRLVNRAIYQNNIFVEELAQIVSDLQLSNLNATRAERRIPSRIQELHMYYQPYDQVVRTGDIVQLALEGDSSNSDMKGIVITPACDLATPKKTPFLRIALIHKGTAQADDKWQELLENGEKHDVCFHEILVLKNQTLFAVQDANQKPAMSYEHTYSAWFHKNVKLTREKRLDEPYRSDLLHHFVSHAGRIGLPDFTAGS